jgi:hypothetical protein
MIRTALLLAGAATLTACNVRHKNPVDGDENVTINAAENGQVTFNLPFVSGQVKLPEGMMANGDFDIDGVKMVPGGTISGLNVDGRDKGSTVDIAFKAPGSPDEVRDYFMGQFKAKGVDAALAGDTITGKTRDGEAFVISVTPAAQGSQGSIKIQDSR